MKEFNFFIIFKRICFACCEKMQLFDMERKKFKLYIYRFYFNCEMKSLFKIFEWIYFKITKSSKV